MVLAYIASSKVIQFYGSPPRRQILVAQAYFVSKYNVVEQTKFALPYSERSPYFFQYALKRYVHCKILRMYTDV